MIKENIGSEEKRRRPMWNSGDDDSLKGLLRKWVLGMNRRKTRLDIKCHRN